MTKPSYKEVKEIAERCRNWGRWGPDDEAGTLNHITPEKVVEAAGLVRRGKVFSLAIPLDSRGPMTGFRGRMNPIHFMLREGSGAATGAQGLPPGHGGADDVILLATHGSTQWDALSHIFWEGKMWNGYECTLVTTSGAERNGIEKVRDRVVSRGVLLDFPRYKKVPWLEGAYRITVADLEGCAAAERVAVGRGDILLVRTGHMAYWRSQGHWGTYVRGPTPGLCLETCRWVHARELAGIASDTWNMEVYPNETEDLPQPLHRVLIPNVGLLIGEIFDLDALAEDCAADGGYEFMLVAPPLTITGGAGSPVNPMAIK